MAKVGQQLLQPEKGWKRYDDTDPGFLYKGGWTIFKYASLSGGSGHESSIKAVTDIVTFRIKSTRLRIITWASSTDSKASTLAKVTIDGVAETFSTKLDSASGAIFVYEKTGLKNTIHTVSIENEPNKYIVLDAIDIDEDGRLLNPDEITSKILFERLGEFYTYNKEDDTIQSLGIISGEERSAFIKEKGLENITPEVLNRVKISAINKSKIVISDY